MAEPLADGGEAHTSVDELRRVGMAQLVQGGSDARGGTVPDPVRVGRLIAQRTTPAILFSAEQRPITVAGVAVEQPSGEKINRGHVCSLLTGRPDNRRPLTWERNRIDVLLLEGRVFECPWTGRPIVGTGPYDLDHLIPLVVYPMPPFARTDYRVMR